MSGDEFLEEIRKTTKEEQEKYEKYNKDFLSSWADRAVVYKKVSSLVQPLFEKILDTVVDYCLEINKKEKSNTFMKKTIDKMVDVLNDYYDDATDKIEEKEENSNYFYKNKDSNKDVDIEKDPKKFYLSEESINEINKGDINLDFKILNKTDIDNLEEETKISKFTEITYDESVFEYNINKCMDRSFMYICISGSNKDVFSSAELILYGLPNNKLKIIEHKKKDQNIIDLENIISYIFLDSDIYIIPEEKSSDNIYFDKIKSLEQCKEYFKSQGKDISNLDESIKYNKGWSDMFERWNKSKETQEESSTIDAIKQTAEETEQIIKDNAKPIL